MRSSTLSEAPRDGLPFLFRHAEDRIDTGCLPGVYDRRTDVWTIETPEGPTPIVLADPGAALEIQTKTKVIQETDDEVPGLVQLRTKTFVTEEVDDDQHLGVGLAEVTTKTHAQIESEDHHEL